MAVRDNRDYRVRQGGKSMIGVIVGAIVLGLLALYWLDPRAGSNTDAPSVPTTTTAPGTPPAIPSETPIDKTVPTPTPSPVPKPQ